MQTGFFDPADLGASDLADVVTAHIRDVKVKLMELKSQTDQYRTMLHREEERQTEMATELRYVDANLDTLPREDIKAKYVENGEVRYRLATMRGQLEKLQALRDRLEAEQTILVRVLNAINGGALLRDGDDDGDQPEPAAPGLNIVRIVAAQEEERKRLANRMHDGPAQSLTNFILQAEICQRLFNRNPDAAAAELNSLKELASTTFQKVRDFIFDLRPMMLDDLGVMPTVRRYVESFRDKNDIEVDLDISGDERRLESYREVMLFRAVQDLMAFARDYADATHIAVRLDVGPEVARVMVEDNGRGFDVDDAFSADRVDDPRVSGLLTLREKFELVQGNMTVHSGTGAGEVTQVRLEMPVGARS